MQNQGGYVVGLIYEKGGLQFQEHGPVILCSGGFGADFSSDSLLAKYRPDLMHLPTTNGEHCTGDGIKMGEAIHPYVTGYLMPYVWGRPIWTLFGPE